MMKRLPVFRFLPCLVLGVVTTVAIAWVCALRAQPLIRFEFERKFWINRGVVSISSAFGITRVVRSWPNHGAPRVITPLTSLSELPLPVGTDYRELATGTPFVNVEFAGWPLRCLQLRSTAGGGGYVARAYEDGIRLLPSPVGPGMYTTEGRVPVRPVWLGLGVNTGAFGTLWWSVFLGLGAMRRAVRRRRGRCEGCGYSRAGLVEGAPCPECGRGD